MIRHGMPPNVYGWSARYAGGGNWTCSGGCRRYGFWRGVQTIVSPDKDENEECRHIGERGERGYEEQAGDMVSGCETISLHRSTDSRFSYVYAIGGRRIGSTD